MEVKIIILGRITRVLINSFKIIHFGKNPKRGGSPLMDNIFRFIVILVFKGKKFN
jgi:hypothetical protein